MHDLRKWPALTAACLLAACSPAKQASGTDNASANAAPSSTASVPVAKPLLPLKELMGHVIQFSAQGIWSRQGYVSDADGERSLFPKTDKEWEDAESASLTLAELSNVLLEPSRRIDDPRWDNAVASVRKIAMQAAQASEHKDKDALFEAGSELDVACESCHLAFAPWAQKPKAQHVQP